MQTMSIKQDELANTGHTHKELTKAFVLERKKIKNNTCKRKKVKALA